MRSKKTNSCSTKDKPDVTAHHHRPEPPAVIWVGTDRDELGWLKQRVADLRPIHHLVLPQDQKFASLEPHAADQVILQRIVGVLETEATPTDRLIWTCHRRIDLPGEAIRWLRASYPELPMALATGTWWEGATRTGAREVTEVRVPWHRWWDWWLPWLRGEPPLLAPPAATLAECALMPSPLPTPVGTASRGEDHQSRGSDTAAMLGRAGEGGRQQEAAALRRGLLVARFPDPGGAWLALAEAYGYQVVLHHRLPDAEAPIWSKVDWALLDDSAFGSSPAATEVGTVLAAVHRRHPRLRLAVADHLPRFDVWQGLERAGVDCLLGKPTAGTGLIYWLREAARRS
ncbi:MAG: hypothetical protein KatS3mg111_0665 [Pirellulaceae bacterium]|nr:MAG: hypothetical protein KatS3mg111_0665 [Pirellulaceae bacterium]